MSTSEQTEITLPLSGTAPQADDRALMPGEFAGMYQAGFEAGYRSGREAGYRQGFTEGHAFQAQPKSAQAADSGVQQGQSEKANLDRETLNARVPGTTPLPVEGQPAAKHGPLDPDTRKLRVPGPPRRMLLGMPCKTCRVYLMSGETHCPCCKQPVAA